MKFLVKQVAVSYESFMYITKQVIEHKLVLTQALVLELLEQQHQQWLSEVGAL